MRSGSDWHRRAGRCCSVFRLASGEYIAADIVVSNVDSAWMYRNLLSTHVKKRWNDASLRAPATRWAFSSGTSERNANIPMYPTIRS